MTECKHDLFDSISWMIGYIEKIMDFTAKIW